MPANGRAQDIYVNDGPWQKNNDGNIILTFCLSAVAQTKRRTAAVTAPTCTLFDVY